MSRQYNWENLKNHLAAKSVLPNRCVHLRLVEIAQIVGANSDPLPTCFLKAKYWTNGKSNKKSVAWISTGYKVIEANLITVRENTVYFQKTDDIKTHEASLFDKIRSFLFDEKYPPRAKIAALLGLIIALFSIIIPIVNIVRSSYTINSTTVRTSLENSNHWYKLGEIAFNDQNFQKAIEYYVEALKRKRQTGEASAERLLICGRAE